MKTTNPILELLLFPFIFLFQNVAMRFFKQARGGYRYRLTLLTLLFITGVTSAFASNSCPTNDMLIDANGRTSTGWTDYIDDNISNSSDEDYFKIVLTTRTKINIYVNNKTYGGKKTNLNILNSQCNTSIASKSGKDYTLRKILDAGTYYAKLSYNNGTTNYKIKAKFPNISDLKIKKSVDHATSTVGDTVIFTLIAKNNGPTKSDIKVTDTIPLGYTINSVSENKRSFSCNTSGSTVICTGRHDFTTNETVTITLNTTASTAGNYTNSAYVESINERSEPYPSNNTDSVSLTINAPVNHPPVANATVSPTSAPEGTNFSFDSSGSTDDGGASNLSYVWKEESTTLSNSATFSKNDFSSGTHTITLTVTDTQGLSNSTDVTMTVTANQAPVANATVSPTSGTEGTNFSFDGSGSTDDGGASNLSYVWKEGSTTLSNSTTFSKNDFHQDPILLPLPLQMQVLCKTVLILPSQ